MRSIKLERNLVFVEDSLNIKSYVTTILGWWKWLVALPVLFSLITYFYFSFQPPSYEATALVALTASSFDVEFDSRFRTVDSSTSNITNAFPELALSDEVIFRLYESLPADITSGYPSQFDLKRALSAEGGDDPSIVRLSGSFGRPENASIVVNQWANELVDVANSTFGGASQESLEFLESQLTTAEEEYNLLSDKFVEFQSRNNIQFLETELEATLNLQSSWLNERRGYLLLLEDVQALHAQFDNGGNEETILNQLAVMGIQQRAFGLPSNGTLVVEATDTDQFVDLTFEEQLEKIVTIENALLERNQLIEEQIEAIEPEITRLNREIEMLNTESSDLVNQRNLARETFLTISRKVQEEQITAGSVNGDVQIASLASVPIEPSSSSLLFSIIVFILITGLTTVSITIYEWLRE